MSPAAAALMRPAGVVLVRASPPVAVLADPAVVLAPRVAVLEVPVDSAVGRAAAAAASVEAGAAKLSGETLEPFSVLIASEPGSRFLF